MKFEDLFPSKQRSNYVELPTEETPTLEKFLAGRVLSPKAKASEPITEQKKEAIKSQFKLAPPAPQTTPAQSEGGSESFSAEVSQQTPVAITKPEVPQETADTGTIQELYKMFQSEKTKAPEKKESIADQAEKMLPEREWTSLLPYLTPMLVGALAGGSYGTSYGIAGEALLKAEEDRMKRKQSLEDKLTEMEKAKQLALAKSSSKGLDLKEVDIDGKPVFFPEELAIGRQAWKKPETDDFAQKVALEKIKAGLKAKIDQGKATQKEKEELRKLEISEAKEWRKYGFTEDTLKVTDAFNKLMKVDPYSADPVKDIGVVFEFMRTLDPRSTVRESEQALVFGARSVQEILDNLKEVISGEKKLTDKQILNIQKFAAKNYERRIQAQKSTVDADFRKRALKYGLDPDMVIGNLSVGIPLLYTDSKTGKTSIISVPESEEQDWLQVKGVQKVK